MVICSAKASLACLSNNTSLFCRTQSWSTNSISRFVGTRINAANINHLVLTLLGARIPQIMDLSRRVFRLISLSNMLIFCLNAILFTLADLTGVNKITLHSNFTWNQLTMQFRHGKMVFERGFGSCGDYIISNYSSLKVTAETLMGCDISVTVTLLSTASSNCCSLSGELTKTRQSTFAQLT